MNRSEIKKDLDKLIDEGTLGGLRDSVIDYIENLLENQAEKDYDRYYGINQDDEQDGECKEHKYSRSMYQSYPRACVKCGEVELVKKSKELSHDELMTKGCDEYHAQKDMQAEREAEDNDQ